MPSGRLAPVLLALLATAVSLSAAGVDGPTLPAADEQILKAAHLSASPNALLDFFRKRTPADVPEKTFADLIRQLGERAPEVHNKAFGELVSYGSVAVPSLRVACNDPASPEAADRARLCLETIEGTQAPALLGAAARGLALFKPANAAEVLLGYYPFADNERVSEEITQALLAVALRDGKADPVLLKAIEDPTASRRACAATVLSQIPGDHRLVVRKLLQDPKATVRLRAALALSQAHDAEAIPVLIDLLAEVPPEQAKPIEEYLARLAGEWMVTVPPGSDEVARRLRRDLWYTWWRGTEGAGLVEQFRKRTPTDAEREKVLGLIRRLDDVSPAVREKAMADLLAMGAVAVPLLRQTVADSLSPLRDPAQKCLALADPGQAAVPLPAVAARLVALRKPDGAVEALLAYLPSAEDETMLTEVQTALAALAFRDGKPDPAMVQALTDKVGVRRAAAAEALCRSGGDEQRPLIRKLLEDPEAAVKLRVAIALIAARDRQAVPVLIGLLSELPPELGIQAESCLRALGGEKSPSLVLTSEQGVAEKCRDAWTAWWREHGHTVDLARLDVAQRQLGYTLVVEQYSQARRSGRVAELDASGKVRWEITGLQTAFDAQVVPGDRVLIVEQGVSRVSERDFKGNITWQKQINLPLGVQRLPNGNTFIAARGQLVEIDRAGKEVFTYHRPNNDIMAAQRLRDGQIAFVTYGWVYVRMDAKAAKELATYRLGPFQFYTNSVHILPGDRVVVPEYNANRVVEYDQTGKRAWDVPITMPSSAQRLPNGNTLISSAAGQRIVEVNRAGKMVWEHKEAFNPWRATRR